MATRPVRRSISAAPATPASVHMAAPADSKPLLSHLLTQEFNCPPNYSRTTRARVDPTRLGRRERGGRGERGDANRDGTVTVL
eukprot:3779653-Pyramimonas_sp.AAC.1